MLKSPRERRISSQRFNLRLQVKRIGKKKTRLQSRHYLSMCERYESVRQEAHIEEFKQACRDVLGGEW